MNEYGAKKLRKGKDLNSFTGNTYDTLFLHKHFVETNINVKDLILTFGLNL